MLGGDTPEAMSATDSVKNPVNLQATAAGHWEKGRGQVASRPSLAVGEGCVPAESLAECSQSLQGSVPC